MVGIGKPASSAILDSECGKFLYSGIILPGKIEAWFSDCSMTFNSWHHIVGSIRMRRVTTNVLLIQLRVRVTRFLIWLNLHTWWTGTMVENRRPVNSTTSTMQNCLAFILEDILHLFRRLISVLVVHKNCGSFPICAEESTLGIPQISHPVDHHIFIVPCIVLEFYDNAWVVLLHFFVGDSLSCPLEYQKGPNSWFAICEYSQLHSTLAFLMATASGSGPARLSSFCLVGRPFCFKVKFQWCLIHVGDVAQIPRTNRAVLFTS